ncbi:MAG: response regulator [Pyrinomonadaceae bacterium]|nr:response regulator [Pyrinomonadaceae bacterium]
MMTPASALSAPTILVIEDYSDTRELLSVLLYRKGYKVLLAASGLEGLLKASGTYPDLILLDLASPGMDGIEAARRIHDTPGLSRIPIFLVSSDLTPKVEAQARAAGCVEMFGKPFDRDSLLETISITLGER